MNDIELIVQIRNGNTNAFRFLVDQNKNLVWHMVLRMIRQREDIEDVCQEVFMKVFRDIQKFRGESKLSTWIGSITYHVCIDYIRKKGREKVLFSDEWEPDESALQVHETTTVQMDRNWLKLKIHELIERMPLSYRTIVTLYHLEGFSYHEISEVTGMPDGTVKSYLSRGRHMLRERLENEQPDIRNFLWDDH